MRRVPEIRYVSEAPCTISDVEGVISLYVKVNPDPKRWVEETIAVECLHAAVDVDQKGNVRGIELLLLAR